MEANGSMEKRQFRWYNQEPPRSKANDRGHQESRDTCPHLFPSDFTGEESDCVIRV